MSDLTYVVADWETYYAPQLKYSLRVMDPPSYILDPRFEEIGCAFKVNGGATHWVDGPDVAAYLRGLGDPSKVVMIAHNILFDASIASWRHGFVAGLYVDTLALSRALLGHVLPRNDLATVARYLGLGEKGTTIHKVANMTRQMIINAGFYNEYAAYSCQDADLCWGIFQKLASMMPGDELLIADLVARLAIVPALKLDTVVLAEHLGQVKAEKDTLLWQAGLDMSTPAGKEQSIGMLMSNEKMAEMLRSMGVEPPMKISPTTQEATYAFAKTDEAFKELLEHPDLAVQALVSARMGHKSTLEETRTERFINISQLDFPAYGTGLFPVALKVSGAHTHRLCLVGDTIIVVLRDNRVVYTRLDDLTAQDLVWDGSAFVAHGGLAYAGVKEVITYQGITGTADHRVRTMEHGYLPLAAAKAGSYDIARGNIPDPARIDPSVQGARAVPDNTSVCMCSVPAGNSLYVEGPSTPKPSAVQVMRAQRTYGWGETFAGNVGQSCGSQPQGRCETATVASCFARQASATASRDYTVTGKAFVETLASCRLAQGDARGAIGVSTMHEPQRNQLFVLRRSRDRVRVCVNSGHGRLAANPFGRATAGTNARSHQHERPLRAGQPSLGNAGSTNEEPQFVETWDIIDCGPRNCFMANGRVVHNSGDWRLNQQNLARPSRKRPRAMLRESIIAPEGYTIIAGDLSQIEARMAAVFCGQWDLVHEFDIGGDPYSSQATNVFVRPVTKANVGERFIGKTLVLSAGYGVGWPKYQASIRHLSGEILGTQIILSDEEAQRHINTYRRDKSAIVNMWRYLNDVVIPQMARPDCDFMLGPVRVMHERIVLPSGLCLHYRGLSRSPRTNDWYFLYGQRIKKLYGGKLLENIIQALARCVIMDAALRLSKLMLPLGGKLAMQVHDELVYLCPDANVGMARGLLETELKRRPTWMLELPLNCEVGQGKAYGKAK